LAKENTARAIEIIGTEKQKKKTTVGRTKRIAERDVSNGR
jgi:hypothetical protein